MNRLRHFAPIVMMFLSVASSQAQEITIQNEAGAPTKLSAAEISTLPHQKVEVTERGKRVVFEGVPLGLILRKAGVTLGETLRGSRMASCLLVEATDGYRVVFALAELDPGFSEKVVLLADKRDGRALDPSEGPFRIIVPDEKRMARWVRQVVSMKIVP